MLVLTRRIRESIKIGEAEVKVLGIKGRYVRLGVSAPLAVPVHREEIYDKIHSPMSSDNELRAVNPHLGNKNPNKPYPLLSVASPRRMD